MELPCHNANYIVLWGLIGRIDDGQFCGKKHIGEIAVLLVMVTAFSFIS